jgi:hypothetical protein
MNNITNTFYDNFDCVIKNIFKKIKQIDGRHKINEIQSDNFIKHQHTEIRRECAKLLIENTHYISMKEILNIIPKLVDKLFAEETFNRSETIYLYVGKESKSFFFLSMLLVHFIRENGYKQPTKIINEITENELNEMAKDTSISLIIIDDLAYSGSQLSGMLYNIHKNFKKIDSIFVLLIALNTTSLEVIQRKNAFSYEKNPYKIIYLPEYCYKTLKEVVGEEYYYYINMLFASWHLLIGDTSPNISAFLDYKIADEESTYKKTLLFGPIVPKSHLIYLKNLDLEDLFSGNSKKFNKYIRKITDIEKEELILDNDIEKQMNNDTTYSFFPLINNCGNDNNYIRNLILFLKKKEIPFFDFLYMHSNPNIDRLIEGYFNEVQKKNLQTLNKIIENNSCPITWYKKKKFFKCTNKKTKKSKSKSSKKSSKKSNK